MRRSLAAGAALLAVILGPSACSTKDTTGDKGGSGAGKKQVTFLLFETPNLPASYWDTQIKRVTDKYPDIAVKKVVSPTEDRDAYGKQLLGSGQFPDVHIGLKDIAGFAEGGNLYAWTAQDLKDFKCTTCGAIGGKAYQLPANTQTHSNVYYNKKLFAQAGITAPPKTYAELLDAAAKLKAKGITPFVIGGGKDPFASSLAWTAALTTDLYAKNPEWMHQRRAGKVKFSDPDFRKATQKFADLASKGYLERKDIGRDYAATQSAFQAGKGAMYPMGSWFGSPTAGDDPKNKFEIGVFPWPGDDGTVKLAAFTGGGLTVSAKAKNLDAAKRFALGFQLDKANLDASVKADALFPAVKGYTPPSMGKVFTATYGLFQQAEQQNATVPSFGWEAGDDAMLPGLREKWYAAAQDLITGKKSVDQVVKFLDAEWEKAS